jgi:hypothetical protein
MCFYHVIAKVQEKIRHIDKSMKRDMFRLVYDVHYARSYDEQEACVKTSLGAWFRYPLLVSFCRLYYKQ